MRNAGDTIQMSNRRRRTLGHWTLGGRRLEDAARPLAERAPVGGAFVLRPEGPARQRLSDLVADPAVRNVSVGPGGTVGKLIGQSRVFGLSYWRGFGRSSEAAKCPLTDPVKSL